MKAVRREFADKVYTSNMSENSSEMARPFKTRPGHRGHFYFTQSKNLMLAFDNCQLLLKNIIITNEQAKKHSAPWQVLVLV